MRANGIRICYQRLSIADHDAPFCLHALNAVYLERLGWDRVDPRGNKDGVDAQFCPPRERLAFTLADPREADLPEIWPDPLPCVVEVLRGCATVDEVYRHLPDIEPLPPPRPDTLHRG